jgi:hypothetical protein
VRLQINLKPFERAALAFCALALCAVGSSNRFSLNASTNTSRLLTRTSHDDIARNS